MDITHFEPTVLNVDTTKGFDLFSIQYRSNNQYRSSFSGPGLFQCSDTALVFGTTGEGEVLYRTVMWQESWYQSTGRVPAGHLFDVENPQQSVTELHLPHCDITPGDVVVARVTEEGVELLKPQRVTGTHVVLAVTRPSIYGILERSLGLFKSPRPKHALVLVFLRPPGRKRRILSVFLEAGNVTHKEVHDQHLDDEPIRTNSACQLTEGQRYTLECLNEKYDVCPKTVPYHVNYGPNFHATIEVTISLDAPDVPLRLLGPDKTTVVWEQNIDLRGKEVRR